MSNDVLHAKKSSLLKKGPKRLFKIPSLFFGQTISKPTSFILSPINSSISLPLSYKRNRPPSSSLTHKNPNSILLLFFKMARTRGGKTSLRCKTSHPRSLHDQLSGKKVASWMSTAMASPSSSPPKEVTMDMEITPSPSFSVTHFIFGFLWSLDL